MYLKSLEIMGFKSFPDKTLIKFGKGMTAIVGPNGSGKSNISDAIRWVLGEQSTRTLRGAKMEDVIFNGTEKRGPVGYAEVTLTIDNSQKLLPVDFDEVAVTRRYYRSGESEFYINKSAVRLKDIHELFMDTGLGRDGYAMIGQGRIDEILSVKSEDRREIFEEAAGISKYRYRKEEAERKIESTEENLVRVRDIIGELEGNVEPLRIKSEKAKKYLAIRDELRGLEVDRWMEDLDRIRVRSSKAAGDLNLAIVELEEAKRTIDTLYAKNEKQTEAMHENETACEEMRARLREMEAEAAQLRATIGVSQTEIGHCDENLKRLQGELAAGEQRQSGITEQIAGHQALLDAAKAQIAATDTELRAKSLTAAQLLQSAGDINRKIDALRASEAVCRADAAQKQSELASASATADSLKERLAAIGSSTEQNSARLSDEEAARAKSSAAQAEAEQKLAEVKNIISGYELRLTGRKKKMEERKDALTKATVEAETLREKCRMLAAMEKDFEGYSRGVKLVMRESGRGGLRNIHGTVGMLIHAPDEYATAIETVLGAALQNIVTATEDDAKKAILYLKQNDAGRATFLPMSAIRPYDLHEQGLENEPGFEGIASRLITYDKQYESIVSNLLGRTVVTSHIDAAIAIAKKYRHAFRIVTRDGQIINAGGSMTGGSTGANAGILSRANQLEKLGLTIKEYEERTQKLTAEEKEAKREYDAASYEYETASAERRVHEDALLSLRAEHGQRDALIVGLQREDQRLSAEKEECIARLTVQESNIERLNKEIQSLLAEAGAYAEKADESAHGRGSVSEQQDSLAGEIEALQSKLSSETVKAAAAEAALVELRSMTESIGGDREKIAGLMEAEEAKKAGLAAQMQEKNDARTALAAACADKEKQIDILQKNRMDTETLRTENDKQIRETNEKIVLMEGQRARLENLKDAAAEEEKQVADKLWEEYELTIGEAGEQRKPVQNMQETVRRINHLKAERKDLGEISVNAIDEYEQLKNRYDFLTAQRDDLDKAKEDLNKIIGSITNEMENIFAYNFKIINENFGKTFQEIFNGGHAELALEDPTDILNCGIEIKAQPPGKSLKVISLLSGGEKAFVAIALYFAILAVRPTPFCVLDEIEAALDEANVIRFAHYVRQLSDNIQFIIITHRRGTMEECDLLYGVTMQQQGITRLISLDISQADEKYHIK